MVTGVDKVIRKICYRSGASRIIDEGVNARVFGCVEQMEMQDVRVPIPVLNRGKRQGGTGDIGWVNGYAIDSPSVNEMVIEITEVAWAGRENSRYGPDRGEAQEIAEA